MKVNVESFVRQSLLVMFDPIFRENNSEGEMRRMSGAIAGDPASPILVVDEDEVFLRSTLSDLEVEKISDVIGHAHLNKVVLDLGEPYAYSWLGDALNRRTETVQLAPEDQGDGELMSFMWKPFGDAVERDLSSLEWHHRLMHITINGDYIFVSPYEPTDRAYSFKRYAVTRDTINLCNYVNRTRASVAKSDAGYLIYIPGFNGGRS